MNITKEQSALISMVGQRIFEKAEPVARADADALEVVILAELAKIGVSHHRTNLFNFIDEVRTHRLNSLLEARTAAVADFMVASSQPASTTQESERIIAAVVASDNGKMFEFLGDAPAPAAAPEPAVVGEMVVKLDIDTTSIDALSARLDAMRQKFGAAAEGVIASFAKAGFVAPTIQSTEIGEGDALVVTVPGILSREQADKMCAYIRAELGCHVRILVADGGTTIAAMAVPADAAPR